MTDRWLIGDWCKVWTGVWMTNLGFPRVFPQRCYCMGDCHRSDPKGGQDCWQVCSCSVGKQISVFLHALDCTIAMIAFTLHVISRSYQKPEGTSTVFLPSKCVSYQNYSHYIARTRLISAHIQMKTAVARCGASCTVEKHGFGSLFEIYSEFTVQWQRVHSLLHQSAQGTSRTALVCIMQ